MSDPMDIQPEDLQKLFKCNPLAGEQLKNIVLEREVASLRERLARIDGTMNPEEIPITEVQ